MEIPFNDIFIPENVGTSKSIIKVIGVGGGGCNAVSEMHRQKIQDVEFLITNTDRQSLETSSVPDKIRLGNKGLGAGCNPEEGRRAAAESLEKIKKALSDATEMVFITAGMGGGTGTGAAPVIAQIAKEMGKLTIGVVTIPFRDEGKSFMKRAILGIKELQKYVDSLLIIDNQKIYEIFGELTLREGLHKADEVLSTAVKGIAEIITRTGFMNVDFADVKMVMQNSGMAIMGTGTASGPDRAAKAVEMAFESPLLNDCDLSTAKGVLVNITTTIDTDPDCIKMSEMKQIMEYVNNYTGNADAFKRGVVYDPEMGDKISVTIVATGFHVNNLPQIDFEEQIDPDRIMLGDSGLYGSGYVPEKTSKIEIDGIQQQYSYGTTQEPQDASQESKEEQVVQVPQQTYTKCVGKPALILEPGDDIVKLETVPAYLRRNRNLQEQIAVQTQPQQQAGSMKVETIDGQHHLSNNSYLHQTQD